MKKKLLLIATLLSYVCISTAQVSKLDTRNAKIKKAASAKTKDFLKTATIECNTATFCPNTIEDLTVFCLFGNCNIPSCNLLNNNADGSITTTNSPTSLTLTGGDNSSGASGNTSYSVTITQSGNISFNWSYTTTDGSVWDYPQVIVNGVVTLFNGYSTSGSDTQSGTMTVPVVAGDTFAFNMYTSDNAAGAASVTINNIVGPSSTTQTYSYSWAATNGGVISGSTTANSITPTTTGTYTFTVTDAGNTTINSNYVNVTINTIDNSVSELTTGILTANQGGASYQWYTCTDTAINGATAQNYTPTDNGDYKVVITSGDCVVESACVTVLGTTDFETMDSKFLIYPNPSTGIVNILSDSDGQCQILNQLGQTLKTFNVSAEKVKSINVENLTDGIYFIKSTTKNQSYKIIIKK